MRHIQAVNANLDFTKLGLHDVGQIIGVDDKGKLLTASANLEEVQTRDVKNPDHIEKQENPNAGYVWPFTRMLGDQKTAGQIAQVKEVVQEASEARLAELGPGWHHVSFTSDGEQREADIYVGKGVDPSKPAPLVYNFHGAGPDSGRGIAEGDTHASRWADANHAIVAYPLAEVHTQPVGNLGGVAGFFKFANPDQVYHAWQTMPNSGLNETRLTYDDQHYVKALDTELSRQLNIDPNRKIMFVFSDSSGLAKNVALDIGASAVIENHGGIKSDLTLPENAGIAYFAVNGEKDPVVPRAGASVYNGFLGNWELRWPKLANADPTRNFNEFAAANGCSGSPQKTESPGQIRTEFTPDQCTTHKPVVEIDRPEDGHAVDNPDPSLLSDIFEIFLGKKDKTYDAFAATVNEALKHPKNGS
jgi:poly(3-hydroxybutyrate) depolymerase